jgi:hypothetical protein
LQGLADGESEDDRADFSVMLSAAVYTAAQLPLLGAKRERETDSDRSSDSGV